CVYGTDNDMLESVLVRMLEGRGLTLALAESCTGGLVSHRITNVPGSSKTLLAGIVAYANKAKTTLLGVPEGMIRKVGAVSPEVAEAMARGAAERTGADIAIGITGIAGPGGGNREKPVGLVYIGIKTPFGDLCTKNILGGNREDVKWRASQAALNQLRMHLIEHGKD
ncbi:MAG: nicotinamide-nucleotide amidohydrolase family protein, partial [Armatimonadota bacterium]